MNHRMPLMMLASAPKTKCTPVRLLFNMRQATSNARAPMRLPLIASKYRGQIPRVRSPRLCRHPVTRKEVRLQGRRQTRPNRLYKLRTARRLRRQQPASVDPQNEQQDGEGVRSTEMSKQSATKRRDGLSNRPALMTLLDGILGMASAADTRLFFVDV